MRRLGLLILLPLATACDSGAADESSPQSAAPSSSAPAFAEPEPCRSALEEVQPLRVALAGADMGRVTGLLDQLEAIVKIGQDECSKAVNTPLVEGYTSLRAEATASSFCTAEPCVTGGDFSRGVKQLLDAETAAQRTA